MILITIIILEFALKFFILRKTQINNPYILDVFYIIITLIPFAGTIPTLALLHHAFGQIKSEELINKILFIKKEEK